jgi:ATP adenylyltransferase
MDRLWAPWRLEYVGAGDAPPGCVFCRMLEQDDEQALIVARGERCFCVLNRFPYASGHLMVAPTRHVAAPAALDGAERAELWELFARALDTLERVYAPHAANAGLNLGRAAGAGVADHLHLHVVPRWSGDTNFMPVLADVGVMPEHLSESWRRLREAWPHEPLRSPA